MPGRGGGVCIAFMSSPLLTYSWFFLAQNIFICHFRISNPIDICIYIRLNSLYILNHLCINQIIFETISLNELKIKIYIFFPYKFIIFILRAVCFEPPVCSFNAGRVKKWFINIMSSFKCKKYSNTN